MTSQPAPPVTHRVPGCSGLEQSLKTSQGQGQLPAEQCSKPALHSSGVGRSTPSLPPHLVALCSAGLGGSGVTTATSEPGDQRPRVLEMIPLWTGNPSPRSHGKDAHQPGPRTPLNNLFLALTAERRFSRKTKAGFRPGPNLQIPVLYRQKQNLLLRTRNAD